MPTPIDDLASRLQLTRPLVFLDLETTGLEEGAQPDPEDDRIVQVGVRKVYPDNHVTHFTALVNPGVPITRSTRDKHGITDAMVADRPGWKDVGRGVAAGLSDSDLIGYNVQRYDVKVLTAECGRHGIRFDPKAAKVIDLYLLWAAKEPRDLAAALKRFTGINDYAGHEATSDVAAALVLFEGILEAFPDLPSTVQELAGLTAREKPATWIDARGKLRWRNGVPTVCFGKHNGQPMQQVPSGYWEYILRSDGDKEIKDMAEAALRGIYPQVNQLPFGATT